MHDLRTRLRAATAEEHRRTEDGFAAGLSALSASGGVQSYGTFLETHARAFPAVGRALDFGLAWAPWRDRWHALQSDLAALDRDQPPALSLTPAASRAEALGMAYVLEGSRLGSTVILRNVPAGLPDAYLRAGLDRAPWHRLLALLETVVSADQPAAIDGAHSAFRAFQQAAARQAAARILEPQA